MTNAIAVVQPLSGPGLVARAGDLLLVCADGGSEVDDLLGLVAEVAAAGGDGGVLVRRVAALLAADFDGSFPPCAVSGPTRDGRVAVLVYGTATAEVAAADGDVHLAGSDAITSVNRLIPGPVTAIRLQLPGAGSAHPRSRLDSGVLGGAGLHYSMSEPAVAPATDAAPHQAAPPPQESLPESGPGPVSSFGSAPPPPESFGAAPPAVESFGSAPQVQSIMDNEPPAPVHKPAYEEPPAPPLWPSAPPPPPPPAPAPAPAPEPAFTPPPPPAPAPPEPTPSAPSAVPALSTSDSRPSRQPDPAAPFVAVLLVPGVEGAVGWDGMDEAPGQADDSRPRVLGVRCQHGHFNNPKASSCVQCGVSMAEQTLVTHEGPRPPLGVLVLDDGMMFRLDTDYVVGREPQSDPEVIAGTVRPLRITDVEGVVSRRHLRVALVGWDVQVVDLGSANGTFVAAAGDPQRHQLVAHQPMVLRPGTQVTMGRRWFRYESHRNP